MQSPDQRGATEQRRKIPSVDRVLRELGPVVDLPRPTVLNVVRRELARRRDVAGDTNGDVLGGIRQALEDVRRSRIQPLINATGVIIHTNFGRSPLGQAVVQSLAAVASNYNNLEFDLITGQRGGRANYLENTLALLCGAQAATVVNNCAAALVLVLRHFASRAPRTRVVISRGELVQIGGGFRIPEILEASGAELREIGTTNKTTLDDYRHAIDPQRTALILKVHQSNFFMGGFVESPSTDQIAATARQAGVPFVEDLGSGATFDTQEKEPTPADALARGADLVTFSGDKLLGGPQAGIIAGSASHVEALKKEPFFRALRCDKLVLAALQTTVDLLLSDQTDQIPIRAMMQLSVDQLRQRAESITSPLQGLSVTVSIGETHSEIGGGSLPRTTLPSICIDLVSSSGTSLEDLATKLRVGTPPVIGRIAEGRLKLDLRTVFPSQDQLLAERIRGL